MTTKAFSNGEIKTTLHNFTVKSRNYKPKIKNDDEWNWGESTMQVIDASVHRAMVNIFEYAIENVKLWEGMITFTIDPKKVKNRYDHDEVASKVSRWLRNVKHRKAPNLEWLLVLEFHKSGALHFHALIGGLGDLDIEYSNTVLIPGHKRPVRSYGEFRGLFMTKHGYVNAHKVYNVKDYNLGFSSLIYMYGDAVNAVKYMCKYFTKENGVSLAIERKGKKKFWRSSGLKKPTTIKSMVDPREFDDIKDSFQSHIVSENPYNTLIDTMYQKKTNCQNDNEWNF